MTNIELLQDALHAAEEMYQYLTQDEKDTLNYGYNYYDKLNLLRCITDRVVADIRYKERERERKQNDLENSNEY